MFQKLDYSTLHCVAYARKSNEADEKQVQSIPDQLTMHEKVQEQYGLDIFTTITDEKSAKVAGKRPGFDEMMQIFWKQQADSIACWKLNRLARNGTEAGMIIDLLVTGQIKAIITPYRTFFPSDNIVMLYSEFGVAQQTSWDISSDVKRAYWSKAKAGWFPSSVLPMGYKHNKDYKLNGGSAIVFDEQGQMVKKLWQEAVKNNYSAADIKRRGDELGIRNTAGKRKGMTFSINTYIKAFTNPFYATGEYWWNTEDGGKDQYFGKHKKMISEVEFNKLQVNFGKRGRPTKINSYDFPLRDAMSCGECGCAITAERVYKTACTKCKRKFSLKNRTDCPDCGLQVAEMDNPTITDRTYYRCTKKRNRGGFRCNQGFLEASQAEQQIQNALSKIQIPEDFHNWAIRAFQFLNDKELSEQENVNKQITKKETELTKQLRQLILMRASDEISATEFSELKTQVSKELSGVRSSKKEYHHRLINWSDIASRYSLYSNIAPKIFAEAGNQRKREILRTLGSNLIVQDQNIVFSMPKVLVGIKSTYDLAKAKNIGFEPKKIHVLQGQNRETDLNCSILLPDLDSNQD